MKRLVPAAVLIAAALATPASGVELTIRPGVGIGKVKLGMTLPEVKRALRGNLMQFSERKRLSRGRHYVEYIWNYSEYRVGFAGGKPLRVVLVATYLRAQRFKDVGVGTERETVKRKLGAVGCRPAQQLPGFGGRYVRVLPENDRPGAFPVRGAPRFPLCILGRDGRATVFSFGGEDCSWATGECAREIARQVIVTRPYFAASL